MNSELRNQKSEQYQGPNQNQNRSQNQNRNHAGNPLALITTTQVMLLPSVTAQYEVSADGKPFLLIRRAIEVGDSAAINLVTDWTAELKKKLKS